MAKLPIKISKGSTFKQTFRYESPKRAYREISNITNTAPLRITSNDHGLPDTWRIKLSNIVGTTELNSNDIYLEAEKIDSNTIEVNSVNAVGFKPYVSGGIMEFFEPVDLTGYSAHMQVRDTVESEDVLMGIETGDGISIDSVNSTITIQLGHQFTENLQFSKGVYSLDLIAPSGERLVLLEGTISVQKEITRGTISSPAS